MNGPFLLIYVDQVVQTGTIGAYILSRDGETAHYVGRSDSDLRGRIKSSSKEGKGYKSFWLQYAKSPWEAYSLEREWYCRYRPTDNAVEPAAPMGLTSLLGLR